MAGWKRGIGSENSWGFLARALGFLFGCMVVIACLARPEDSGDVGVCANEEAPEEDLMWGDVYRC